MFAVRLICHPPRSHPEATSSTFIWIHLCLTACYCIFYYFAPIIFSNYSIYCKFLSGQLCLMCFCSWFLFSKAGHYELKEFKFDRLPPVTFLHFFLVLCCSKQNWKNVIITHCHLKIFTDVTPKYTPHCAGMLSMHHCFMLDWDWQNPGLEHYNLVVALWRAVAHEKYQFCHHGNQENPL